MSSRQSNSTRKKTPSKSLLIRLSESCNSHRTKFHNPDDEHDVECDSEPSPQCSSDMKALRGIIPKIEASCQCRKLSKDGNRDRGEASDRSARDVNAIDPKEVNNLCLFYVSVLECVYCPHSMELLFDHGRGGVESK